MRKKISLVSGFAILGISILAVSCKPIVSILYNPNSHKTFKSKKDYFTLIEKQYGIKPEDMYIPDSSDWNSFVAIIAGSKMDNYYGTFKASDSVFVKSDFLQQNESCMGRILGDISLYEQSGIAKADSFFYKIDFRSATDGHRIFPKNNYRTLVFIFSYKQGKIPAKGLKEIQNKYRNNAGYQLLFISLDQIPKK